MLQSVITRPWGTKTNLKTLCHFTDLLRKSLLLFVGTQYVSTRQIIRHSPQSLFVLKGEAIIQLHNIPLWCHFHLSGWVSNLFHNKVGAYSGQCLSFYTREPQVALWSDWSDRLHSGEVNAIGWVGAFVPCVHLGGSDALLVSIHNVRVERLHIDVSDGAAG